MVGVSSDCANKNVYKRTRNFISNSLMFSGNLTPCTCQFTLSLIFIFCHTIYVVVIYKRRTKYKHHQEFTLNPYAFGLCYCLCMVQDKTRFVYKSANYLSVMMIFKQFFFLLSIANHMQPATLVLKSEIGSNFKVKLPANNSRSAHNR
jgi:hypothetical protein